MAEVFIKRGWFGRHRVYVRDGQRTRWLATCLTIELAEAVQTYMVREITRALVR